MLDFPQFTKDTFPGVTHMDLFSGLFGDVTDDSMFAGRTFDPSTPSARKWLDRSPASWRRPASSASTSPTTRRPIWPDRRRRPARPVSRSPRSGSRDARCSA